MPKVTFTGAGTMTGVRRGVRPFMLGLGAAALLCACSADVARMPDFRRSGPVGLNAERSGGADLAQPMVAPTREPREPAQPVRDLDTRSAPVLNPEVTATPPVTRTAPPAAPPDPGAVALIDDIIAALGDPQQGEDGVTRIGVTALRNQSRSSREDFLAMRHGLMALLTEAGRERRIVFTDAQELAVQYHLEGAAYRLDDRRADQWELFLRLMQDESGVMVWEPAGPVRLFRGGNGRLRIRSGR